MKLSVSISPIFREYGLSELEIFALLRQCGFASVDYDFCPANQSDWLNCGASAWGKRLKGALSGIGVSPAVAHISGFNPLCDGAPVEQAVRCAGALGVKKVIIPLGWRENNARREYEQLNLAYLKRLLPIAAGDGVTLLIEHSGSWLGQHYTHHAIELIRLTEMLGEPENLKINLNIARLGVAEIKPYTEICLLGDRILNVDLADNFGGMPLAVHPEREELGLAPMMGYIDYDRVMQGLKEINYTGDFNLRMNMPRVFPKQSPYHESAPLRCMPLELTQRLHRWSLHIAEHMLRMYGFAGEVQK